MAEDFTTYTETDAGGLLTVAETSVTWDDVTRASAAIVWKDFGADYFGSDLHHRIEFTVPANGDMDDSAWVYFWAITNVGGTSYPGYFPGYIETANGDYQSVCFVNGAGDMPFFQLRLSEAGNVVLDTSTTLTASTKYYLDIVRDDDGGANGTGQYTVYVCTGNYYTESGYSLIDTLTVDCSAGEQNDFRYMYVTLPRGSGAQATDGVVESLDMESVTYYDVSGTITATWTVAGTINCTVNSYKPILKKRVVAIGNDCVYYEDV